MFQQIDSRCKRLFAGGLTDEEWRTLLTPVAYAALHPHTRPVSRVRDTVHPYRVVESPQRVIDAVVLHDVWADTAGDNALALLEYDLEQAGVTVPWL